jgi:hypothetical protein
MPTTFAEHIHHRHCRLKRVCGCVVLVLRTCTLLPTFNQADYESCFKILEKVVADRRRVLGPEDVTTLLSVSALARSLHKLRRHAEAVTMQQQVLETSRRVSGENHPVTLDFAAGDDTRSGRFTHLRTFTHCCLWPHYIFNSGHGCGGGECCSD